jgi:hypothetical protein
VSINEAALPDKLDVVIAAQIVWDLYRQADGATFNLYSGDLAGKSLYAVSIYGDRTRDVDESAFSINVIEAFIRANSDLLLDPENSGGVWLAAEEGQVYLYVSLTVQDRQYALALAREHGEQAICHFSDLTVEYIEYE